MNIFQITLKQARQRSLSTWLTLLSVTLGMGLVIAIMLCRREGQNIFGQTDYGYELIVGAKGSPLQLTLNTVYDIDRSPGNIPYTLYEKLLHDPSYRPLVRIAIPTAVGDSYRGRRIVATLPSLFGINPEGNHYDAEHTFEYRPGKSYQFAAGHAFDADKFEAVIGSDMTRLTGLKIGDVFQATHGFPAPGETPDIHKPKWTIVGILQPTHTAADGVVYIPLTSFYTIAEHGTGLVAQAAIREGKNVEEAEAQAKADELKARGAPPPEEEEAPDNFTIDPTTGKIHLLLPKEVWGISAILVKTPSPFTATTLQYAINNGPYAQAANPAGIMREFFSTFLDNIGFVMQLISILVVIVADIGILVSIYNAVVNRRREIAIFRALGATRTKIVAMICMEAGFIGLVGSLLGIVIGHAIGAVASVYLTRYIGESLNWTAISAEEFLYLGMAVILAILAGLIPALVAYRTPVATNLTAT